MSKVTTIFDIAFDKHQKRFVFDTPLMRIKGDSNQNTIHVFDLIFDKDQMCSKSNFSCGESVFKALDCDHNCLFKEEKVCALKKSSTPTELVWYSNKAEFSLFRRQVVTLCENY